MLYTKIMEIWKAIIGFDGAYDISDHGRVRSWNYRNSPKVLKMSRIGRKGYLKVGLSRKNKLFQRVIHRLVAEYFIENPNNKDVVNHIDEDVSNNHYSNLEWCTQKENINKHHAKNHNPDLCYTCKQYRNHISIIDKFSLLSS